MTDAVVYVDIHVCTSQEARANGTFCGFSFASDESPPSENRFAGLRFQVTYVYITLFEDSFCIVDRYGVIKESGLLIDGYNVSTGRLSTSSTFTSRELKNKT